MAQENLFAGKKITVVGLGLLGGALNDTIFLAEQGAELLVTDLKTKQELRPSLKQLSGFKNITYVLGEHRLEDFRDADFILQPGNIPTDSPFLAEARSHNVPVFVSESLFALHTKANIIGITGTRGKSTVTQMIYETLKRFPPLGARIFLGGNVKNVSTLALLSEVSRNDIVVLELDSWALHGMGDIQKSPHISVFTTFMPDHMNFYKNDLQAYFDDKANIFKYQTEADYLIMGSRVVPIIADRFGLKRIASKKCIAGLDDLPADIELRIPGEHNLYNAACAWEALRAAGVQPSDIRTSLESFAGMPGRLELVREWNDVRIYNDTNATTPDAARAGLEAVSSGANAVLIMGGADKGLDASRLLDALPAHCKKVVLLSGTGTEKILPAVQQIFPDAAVYESLESAFGDAISAAASGDVILFSPAFASFGMFLNEYDRGDQFNALVQKLK